MERFPTALRFCLTALLALAVPALAATPLDESAPFSLPAKEIAALAAAAPVPAGADVVVLLDASAHRFDDAGRQVARRHRIYRIASARGISAAAVVEAPWLPWHQDRPVLAARVVTAAGEEIALDASTVTESVQAASSGRRLLRAPLPGLAVGAVVETEVVVTDRDPFPPAGAAGSFTFTAEAAVSRLTLESPAARPLLVSGAPGPLAPVRSEEGGLVRDVFTLRPAAEGAAVTVRFAPRASWSDLARAYAEKVDAAVGASDVKAAAAPATGLDAKRAVAALSSLLGSVRRQGAPFGESPLDPAPPADVLSRRFGESEDLATLAVALLRSAGLRANVALVRDGFDDDVAADLPSLHDFRHALVLVAPDVWIDPAAPSASLPAAVQGRLALVADAGTSALVRTPEAGAEDNRLTITQEIRLAEEGPARIVETSEATGAFAAMMQRGYGDVAEAKLRGMLQDLVEKFHLAKELASFEVKPPEGASPFRLVVESEESALGATDEDQAVAALSFASLFDDLPAELRASEPIPADGKERLLDFPHVAELKFRIVPPPGFVAVKLPEKRSVALGPARYSTEWSQDKDGAVTGLVRFDAPERRLSAEQSETLRAAVWPLVQSGAVAVRFEQTGARHLEAGRLKEAVAELRRLAALHPTEARHECQVARALLASGLGESAVAAARRAVELQPDDAAAHRALGEALLHDPIGRPFGAGADLAAAEAELRNALELDPADGAARELLGEILERDAHGNHYVGPRLSEAVALYAGEPEHGLDDDAAQCLLFQERFEDLAKLAEQSDLADREALLATAEAGTKGASAAVTLVRSRLPDAPQQRRALFGAAMNLWLLRRYPDASRLLRDSAPGARDEADRRAFAEELARTKRHDQIAVANDAAGLVRRFLLELMAPAQPGSTAGAAALISETIPAEAAKDLLEDVADEMKWLRAYDLRFRDLVLDAIMSLAKTQTDGTEMLGYRVRMSISGDTVDQEAAYFVVREKAGYRLAGMAGHLGWLGSQAMSRFEGGDVAGAKKWLDRARENVTMIGAGDPLAGPAFTRLWAPGLIASPEDVHVAAASLLGTADPARCLPVLLAARAKVSGGVPAVDLDMAIAEAYAAAEKNTEALEVYRRLSKARPSSVLGFLWEASLLEHLGKYAELKTLAEARLRTSPKEPVALAFMATAASGLGDIALAQATFVKLQETGKLQGLGDGEAAWNALLAGSVDPDTLARAKRAAEKRYSSFGSKARALRTYAAAQVEMGQLAAGRETLMTAIGLQGGEPAPDDWYVFGRIAEILGDAAAARRHYQKVKPEDVADLSGSAWTLAKRRLAQLPGEKAAARS